MFCRTTAGGIVPGGGTEALMAAGMAALVVGGRLAVGHTVCSAVPGLRYPDGGADGGTDP